ncbi:MAG TPA: TetR/AcrR family transcriptional regulator C-terminal domain-containing protein, partial [Streptosporangiaceae bacterium]|nr:TetR/AcrR family transcriptional regulator C-terminal domain-containing protein [Streptosporangiaceae bacterium]
YVGELIGQYAAVTALEEETFRDRFGSATEEQINEWVNQFRDYLLSLPARQFPTLIELVRTGDLMSPGTGQERFELGLDIILRGLASYAADSK